MLLNEEYESVKAHLNILQKQKQQALTDIQRLKELKEEALQNPLLFIAQLKKKTVSIPKLQQLYRIPNIDHSSLFTNNHNHNQSNPKYVEMMDYIEALNKQNRNIFESTNAAFWHLTHGDIHSVNISIENERQKIKDSIGFHELDSLILESRPPSRPSVSHQSPVAGISKESTSTDFLIPPHPLPSPQLSSSYESVSSGLHIDYSILRKKRRIRTPVIPWTIQEHNQLIDLLTLYPPSSSETQKSRYLKIASALGTRTLSQISSRVHNLMARGKLMKISIGDVNGNSAAINAILGDFDGIDVRTEFGEDEESLSEPDFGHDFLLDSGSEETLKKAKRNNGQIVKSSTSSNAIHFGYRCDGCLAEPIIGKRYRCKECEDVDLCGQCKDHFTSSTHFPQQHQLIIIEQAVVVAIADADNDGGESRSLMGEYAYLDPNFV